MLTRQIFPLLTAATITTLGCLRVHLQAAYRSSTGFYNPLLTFSSRIDEYVAESLRREGRGDAISQNSCSACEDTDFCFRCITCRDARLFCRICIISLHTACPTHVIQSWNGNYFDKVPLRKLGMRYQVGHLAGEGHGFFLATDTQPRTAVTTAALEQFQMLTFMGKISAYEYYHSLVRLTDNTGITAPSDNFDAFIRVVRQVLGTTSGGWKAAEPGSCAVECLACPRPGVNILDSVDPDSPHAWEHTLYVGMDANFHLERFNVSSEEKDPGLSKGLAYFVDTKTFHKHLADFDKRIIQPPSSCSNHEAAKGDKRGSIRTRDLAASGVGGVVCTRHELKLPLCTVDLRVGETQVEMDFGYLTAVKRFAGVPRIVTSYDIACQWSINLEERINIYGDFMRLKIPKKVYLVPKFHLPGHIKDCQEKYCMSFHIHTPERSWAISNGVAASTREMGPGHRRKKLDQHFGDFNWHKNVSQGDTLLRKIKDASSLPQSDVVKWTKMVEDWEVDRNKPNPFARTVANAQDELVGLDGDALHTTSPKGIISQGIQLESSQRRISCLNKELGRAQILENVESWFVVQEVHMPTVRTLRIRDNQGNRPSCPAYSLPLYLPSSILPAHPCDKTMVRAESRLRIAQGQLLSLSKAYKDGDTNVLTQKERLKSHKMTRDLNARITQAKQYYRDLGEWGWQAQLLIADDEVGISEGNRSMSWIWYCLAFGRCAWRCPRMYVKVLIAYFCNSHVLIGLRIEWCKARARAHRWREECKLLKVEMDCVKCTLEYEANRWLSRAKSTAEGVALINASEGAGAYAKCQAAIRTSIRLSFEDKWRFVEQWLELGEMGEASASNEENLITE
ncbi:hypothetical protein EDD18DRAFT_1314665 [Armillaria luteobubalina]|uniref:CxC2-like cysteine cluster KDZ transposase-associated domain-containing protein n=1 Tax=Armillaria luteobubalina TaxID=153913 RepID=A0AA39NUS8_9AGAR|nr:hypothetical protein EDD18DRAFT_1314665 [Armillaria luteobubalina]